MQPTDVKPWLSDVCAFFRNWLGHPWTRRAAQSRRSGSSGSAPDHDRSRGLGHMGPSARDRAVLSLARRDEAAPGRSDRIGRDRPGESLASPQGVVLSRNGGGASSPASRRLFGRSQADTGSSTGRDVASNSLTTDVSPCLQGPTKLAHSQIPGDGAGRPVQTGQQYAMLHT